MNTSLNVYKLSIKKNPLSTISIIPHITEHPHFELPTQNKTSKHQVPSLQGRSQKRDSQHISCWNTRSNGRYIDKAPGSGEVPFAC